MKPAAALPLLALLALGFPALAAPALAQPPSPLTVELDYAGVLSALHLPEVKVLDLHAVERAGRADFASHAETHSFGILRALKLIDLTTDATGPVGEGVPQPRVFSFVSNEKKKVKRVTLTWTGDDVVQTPPHKDGGEPPPTPALKHASADPVTVFSRAVYAPSAEALCERNWRFYDGAQIYELQFQPAQPAEPSTAERAMGLSAAVTCKVGYAEVAGFHHKPGDHHADWLKSDIVARFGRMGAAGPWIFVALTADTFLGYAKVELTHAAVRPG
jgi:hypothetical protein